MDPADPTARNLTAGEPTSGDLTAAGDPTTRDSVAGIPTSVPSAATCCSTGQDPLLFLQALRDLWSTRNLQQLREEAWQGFAGLDNPLARLLDMLEGCQDQQGKGHSLEAWLTHELQCWLQTQPHLQSAQHSTTLTQLQARAIEILTESPPSLVEPLVNIFQLQDTDTSSLLDHIHHLYNEGKFKEAIVLGTKLKLQPELDIEKMSTPLLLQGKVNLVESYVAGFPELQKKLLALMDSWCQPGFNIRDVARQYPRVTSVKLESLSPKILSRQVLRLQQQYHMAPALCPNVIAQRCLGALKYLCYKRFVEKSMSQEIWVDHVQDQVEQNPWLQEQLLQLVASHSDLATTAQCSLDLSLPEEQLPAAVAAELSQLRLQGRTSKADSRLEEPQENVKEGYYQLPITRENIHFLSSWEDLARHETALLQPGRVIGVDVEWKPSFAGAGRPQASILQVAEEGRVFLLDVPALSQPPGGQGAKAFSNLVSQLLLDSSITKVGYGMVGDLKSLGTVCPTLAGVGQKIRGIVDLLPVHRRMQVANILSPSVDGSGGPRGLSLLVQQVLGKPLDKAQQLSNWDRRPLCEGQLVYAAADAYCLLEVHQALCREPGLFCQLGDLSRSQKPKFSRRPVSQEPTLQEAPTLPKQVPMATREGAAPKVPARAFRVVCDSMLQGLARSLRCLGVDVVMLGNNENHHKAAEVARQEGRIILTSGMPYQKLCAQVGAGCCLSVNCALKAQQQAKDVLRHFNVHVTRADIFSRCQACNGDQYLKVSKILMKQLMQFSGQQVDPSSTDDEAIWSKDSKEEPAPAPKAGPGGCNYGPPCRWLEAEDLQASPPATLDNGTRLQLEKVPAGVLRRPGLQHFYCCMQCGKVFWDGSHLGRITQNFHEILEDAPSPCGPS